VKALVTRPREDAAGFAAELARRGIEPVIEPLLTIRLRPAELELGDVQALLFTSANGVRAFAASSRRRDLRALAVGDATAEEARRHGFARVESAEADVGSLASLAIARLSPGGGVLLHPAGTSVAGDLAASLAPAGFSVRRAVLYDAEPAGALSPGVAGALRQGEIAAAFFFSPRTAVTFVSLATAEAPKAAAAMTAYCLSPTVARAVEKLGWGALRVAAAPRQAELLAALDVIVAGHGADAGSSVRGRKKLERR
jgi:uroporphyrinogen-III synthase